MQVGVPFMTDLAVCNCSSCKLTVAHALLPCVALLPTNVRSLLESDFEGVQLLFGYVPLAFADATADLRASVAAPSGAVLAQFKGWLHCAASAPLLPYV